ncbi:5065_t:CDS:2, partial [Entrophospora sp. SA101]
MSPSKIISHSNITKIIPNPESQPTSSSWFKRFVLEPFPENIFANLFSSQNNFSYSPAKRCYICIFKNTDGRNDLSSILNNDEWWKKINITTGTISFIVMEEDGVVKPEIKFIWKEKFLNNMKCGFCKVEFN